MIERLAHYAPGALVAPYEAAPPANAERLGRSSLRIFNPGYDDQADASYADYARNYGWYVLDNPTHPGGRTNQRASLYAAALSLLGVPAQELYVHRWGYGPRTGRLVRRYYQLSSGGQAFNHHTLVQVRLPSGERCYDPYQPEAIQGAFEELVAPGGKVIGAWLGWRYADTQSPVPADDVPAEYVAAGRIGYGQWTGVPLAPGEPAAPEAEAVVVEVRRSDTGARSATFEVRVRSSRGRAAELGQLFVPHAAAVAGSGVTGGALTARVPDWARVEAEHLDLRLPADPRLARLLVEALRPRFAPTPRTDPLEERAIRLR